ncbi:MAG: transglycosylase SLT domain-containing protein [Burkholderiaceae bacterium]
MSLSLRSRLSSISLIRSGVASGAVRSFLTVAFSIACIAPTADAAKPTRPAADPAQLAARMDVADDAFLAARESFRAGDVARGAVFAQRVTSLDPRYALAPYLEYWALSRQIRDYGDALTEAAPDEAVRGFIARNPGSVVADLARRDWLLALGKRGEWTTFEAEMPRFALNDDAQVTCFNLTARAIRQIHGTSTRPDATDTDASSDAASITGLIKASRVALAQPKDYASDIGACATLGRILVAEKRLTQHDIWSWVRLASDANDANAARRYAQLLSDAERGGDSVRFYRQLDAVLDKPALWLAKTGEGGESVALRWKRELAVLAFARIARADPAMGAASLQRQPADMLITSEVAYLQAQLAAAAAKKQMPETDEWSKKSLSAEGLSEDILGWQVRGALRAEDWKLVEALIEKMPPEMRRPQASDGTWAYWLGRAYKAQKKNDAAQAQFRPVSDQFGFYGQLATEELGEKVTLPARGQPISESEVMTAKAVPGFQRALYFYRLDLRREGNLEWNFALRGMSDRELLASAEWAMRNKVLDRAVNTADRTRNEHDFAFRFLMPFQSQMQEKAAAVGLDLDWVYGLIRQESRFVQVARSSVGASGLMQLMPSTAKYVARKIGLDSYRPDGVADLDTNLTLGTSYLRMVLDDLDNLPVLATAAYNAGPGRPRAWRATLTRPVEGAIFAETIPFNETRDYVKKVMSNATYYAVLITGTPQSLKARMGFVAQRGYTASDLP